jgi:hypothetical protein
VITTGVTAAIFAVIWFVAPVLRRVRSGPEH